MSNFTLFEYETPESFNSMKDKFTMQDTDCNKLIDYAKSRCGKEISGARIYNQSTGYLYALVFRSYSKVFVVRVFEDKDFTEKLRFLCREIARLLKLYGYYHDEGVLLLYDNNGHPSIAHHTRKEILIEDALSKDIQPLIYDNVSRLLYLISKLPKPVNTVNFSLNISSTDIACWDYSTQEPGAIRVLWQHV